MIRSIQRLALPGLMIAGLAVAQTPAPPASTGSTVQQPGRSFARGRMANKQMSARRAQRMAQVLQLTDAQKAEMKAIRDAAKPTLQPLRDRMKAARKELAAAVRGNAPANEIDRISNEIGTVTAQLTSARAKTRQQVFTVLTPEQKAKLDQLRQNFTNRRANG